MISLLKATQLIMSTDDGKTTIGKKIDADDKASVVTVMGDHEAEGPIKPYVPDSFNIEDDKRTCADNVEDPTFKFHNKMSLSVQEVMVVLAGAERAAGLSLVTLSGLSKNPVLCEWLKEKPEAIEALNRAQVLINEFLTYVHNKNVDATIKWQPHMEFVLRTLQKSAEENEAKEVEAKELEKAREAAKPSADAAAE